MERRLIRKGRPHIEESDGWIRFQPEAERVSDTDGPMGYDPQIPHDATDAEAHIIRSVN
ncbi:hypothetical protein G5C51_06940 [Streptomyces sp. A7024]|uniref:Uncharacterized protein n=1 Tax=Streptomyces coryli TaxID=1128680 RepID=A0A6G4TUZ9_9ACTN|nr:hypothetical protein [Streptomyces coryli]NGN63643.1 hypothetical protein [Streptomyces coryli]